MKDVGVYQAGNLLSSRFMGNVGSSVFWSFLGEYLCQEQWGFASVFSFISFVSHKTLNSWTTPTNVAYNIAFD